MLATGQRIGQHDLSRNPAADKYPQPLIRKSHQTLRCTSQPYGNPVVNINLHRNYDPDEGDALDGDAEIEQEFIVVGPGESE